MESVYSTNSIKALNRRICSGETGILYQHGLRHVDVLVECLELENGNTVQTPRTDNVKDVNRVWLESEKLSKYRHHVARCVFFSQDRADNIRCDRAVPKNVRSFTTQPLRIETTCSVLEGERQWIQVFGFGDKSLEVTVFSDSDWTGNKEMRKSSSAGVALVRRPFFERVHKKTEDHRQKQSFPAGGAPEPQGGVTVGSRWVRRLSH